MRKNYAVIAAGGLGTRLKNFKDNLHTKVLIDIDGMSMISTQINQLKSWGFSDFIVITNPDFHDLIVDDIKQNHRNLNVSFVVQDQPKGIAHALSFAESKIDDDSKLRVTVSSGSGERVTNENSGFVGLESVSVNKYSETVTSTRGFSAVGVTLKLKTLNSNCSGSPSKIKGSIEFATT